MNTAKGKLFNGIKSLPVEVEISLDEENSLLIINGNDINEQWNIKDALFTSSNSYLEINYGTSPAQQLVTNDQQFKSAILKFRSTKGYLTIYEKLVGYGLKVHLLILFFILGLITMAYFILLPWVAEKAVALIPEEYDTYLSDDLLSYYLKENLTDTVKTNYLNKFADNIEFGNSRKIKYYVIKSDIVNAFALPDGSIIVFTGILNKIDDVEELTSLLAHEVSHVNGRHSMKMLCRNLSGYLFLSVVINDVNGVMTIMADNVNNLQNLTFSRKFEAEADENAVKIMYNNNINPNGMLRLFKHIGDKNENYFPAFLSTHPLTDKRIKDVKEMIEEGIKKTFAANSNLHYYFKQLKK